MTESGIDIRDLTEVGLGREGFGGWNWRGGEGGVCTGRLVVAYVLGD
jgi:hypothetical protein